MATHFIALNGDTGEDWSFLQGLEIIAVNDDELADLEADPSYHHHDWYNDKQKIIFTDETNMYLSHNRIRHRIHISIPSFSESISSLLTGELA